MKQEPLSLNIVKTIMVVTIFVCLGALIGAIGYLAMKPKSESVVLQPTEEESEIDISDWKIYRNEKYGFEIKYPPNWDYNEEDISYLHYVIPRGTKSGIQIRYKPINKTYSSSGKISYVPVQIKARNFPYQISEYEKEVVINGIKFMETEPVPGRPSRIFFAENPKGSGSVMITDFIPVIVELKAGISSREKSSYEAIFNQMLSTFKFIEKQK